MRWIPIAEAEALLGKKERNARYWLDRHRIPARGERPKRWSERAILAALAAAGQTPGHGAGPPPERAPEYPPAAAGMPAGTSTGTPPRPIEAAYRVTPTDVERAVERTGARYLADMETILSRVGRVYEGQLAAKDETIAAQRDALAELRRRAERAEAERQAAEEERDALRLRLAEVTVPPVVVVAPQEAPEPPPATTPPSTTAQGLWARLRRALGRT